MHPPLIYIAGPFRASSPAGVAYNVEIAEAAALTVWNLGAVAVCPHTMCRNFDGKIPDELVLAGTMQLMRRCDAVLLLDGWMASVGALAEVEEAEWLGIPVLVNADSLKRWLKIKQGIEA